MVNGGDLSFSIQAQGLTSNLQRAWYTPYTERQNDNGSAKPITERIVGELDRDRRRWALDDDVQYVQVLQVQHSKGTH
jgi:hypothetical protein